MKHLIPLIIIGLLAACTGSHTSDAPEARVVPLYSYLATNSVPDSDSIELAAFMRTVSEQPLSPELVEAWASSQVVTVFTPDVDSVYTDSAYMGRMMGKILTNAKAAGLTLPDRRYATIVYGRPESILFVDSVMLIALNHYLGADYPGYSHWPKYMRQVKTPAALPYDIAEALVATSYPYSLEGEEATALSRMIYEGALTIAKMKLSGNDPATALGYSPETMDILDSQEADIWRRMVQAQLLYDTSEATIDRLVAPAPEAGIVGAGTPGRVGRYIGYRIVSEYLGKYPDTTLPQLLDPDFYRGSTVLTKSAYMAQ